MKFVTLSAILMNLFFIPQIGANESVKAFKKSFKKDKERIQESVDAFFTLELLGAREVQYDDHDCEPRDRSSCLQVSCSLLPAYACDSAEEMRAVSKMCQKVRGGSCIKEACAELPSYNCDQLNEIEAVAGLCGGLPHNTIGTVCSYLQSYQCDELRELREISAVFQNKTYQTLRCLKYTCSRLPSYQCDELRDLAAVVDMCEGN